MTVKLLLLSGLTRNEGKESSHPEKIWEANEVSWLQLGEIKRKETPELLHADDLGRKEEKNPKNPSQKIPNFGKIWNTVFSTIYRYY